MDLGDTKAHSWVLKKGPVTKELGSWGKVGAAGFDLVLLL